MPGELPRPFRQDVEGCSFDGGHGPFEHLAPEMVAVDSKAPPVKPSKDPVQHSGQPLRRSLAEGRSRTDWRISATCPLKFLGACPGWPFDSLFLSVQARRPCACDMPAPNPGHEALAAGVGRLPSAAHPENPICGNRRNAATTAPRSRPGGCAAPRGESGAVPRAGRAAAVVRCELGGCAATLPATVRDAAPVTLQTVQVTESNSPKGESTLGWTLLPPCASSASACEDGGSKRSARC